MLEKIEETFTSLGNSIKNGASSITENISLNAKISEAKKEIGRLYAEIGEKLYVDNKENAPEGFEDQFAAIKERYEVIDECNAQIKKNSGIRECPVCGADVEKDHRFCNKCGTKVPEENKEEAKHVCDKCGALCEDGAAFCTKCGAKIERSEK